MPILFRSIEPSILVIEYVGSFSDEEFDSALGRMGDELGRAASERRTIAFVSVGAADSGMTAKQRRRAAEWLEENTPLLQRACVGQAMVLPGALQRGVLTAILWMRPYPVPMRACSTESEAVAYVRSLM